MTKAETASEKASETALATNHDDHREALRKRCLALRKRIDPSTKKQYDAVIIARLLVWLENHPPESPSDAQLALWWPIGSEPDWRAFAPQIRKAGWQLALPCLKGKNQPLAFARFDEDTVLRSAGLGIMEPAQTHWVNPWVIAAPCVGFFGDYRLGFGGGYYDRTLALLDAQARARTIAIAYSICEVELEPKGHDIAFGTIITEA